MNQDERTALAARLEQLAGLAAAALERLMADSDAAAETRRARELTAMLRDLLGLAGELRGEEARELTVQFLGAAGESSV